MEEANELIRRLTAAISPFPSSPAVVPPVKFVETYYPEFKENLSTSKSPIGMQGRLSRRILPIQENLDPKKDCERSGHPCTAKKFEIRREEMCSAGMLGIEGMRDMDSCHHHRELAQWARAEGIDFPALEPSGYDPFMGTGSGAGVIFGNTGGVMEAAVRTAYAVLTGEPVPDDLYDLKEVRGLSGTKEASLTIAGTRLDIAVVYGTANARRLLDSIKRGEKFYQFIEVMTCPGGCIGGGGQPKDKNFSGDGLRQKRIDGLYARDRQMKLRLSHENRR